MRSRKRIQTKQKNRRPSLITIGAQHIVVPAEPKHGLNFAFKHLLSVTPIKHLTPSLHFSRVSPKQPALCYSLEKEDVRHEHTETYVDGDLLS